MIVGGALGFGPIAGLPIADVLLTTAAATDSYATTIVGRLITVSADASILAPADADIFAPSDGSILAKE